MDLIQMGKRIKHAREEKGYTQEQLAEKLDLSVQHISVIERGKKAPRLETFVKIANELDVSADYMLGDLLSVSPLITSNDLYEKISHVSPTEKKRILKVVDVLLEDAE